MEEQSMSAETTPQDTRSEQILYARVLEMGMYLGLVILFITFGVYVSGLMTPAVAGTCRSFFQPALKPRGGESWPKFWKGKLLL